MSCLYFGQACLALAAALSRQKLHSAAVARNRDQEPSRLGKLASFGKLPGVVQDPAEIVETPWAGGVDLSSLVNSSFFSTAGTVTVAPPHAKATTATQTPP